MPDNKDVTKRIRVYGIVQGVGFRPTVARHAAAAGIRGSVCNKGPYVEIYAREALNRFLPSWKLWSTGPQKGLPSSRST